MVHKIKSGGEFIVIGEYPEDFDETTRDDFKVLSVDDSSAEAARSMKRLERRGFRDLSLKKVV